MMMYEAIALADQNNRVYECEYATYSKEKGFHMLPKSDKLQKFELLDIMAHENIWKLKDERKLMSIEEIEKELGYKIKLKPKDDDRLAESIAFMKLLGLC